MKPITKKERQMYYNGPKVSVVSMNDDSVGIEGDLFIEDGELSFVGDKAPEVKEEPSRTVKTKMSDEEIKIKAFSQAINIAKLLSDVTLDNILKITLDVARYIKG